MLQHIEHVHVTFRRQEIFFDKIKAFFDLDNFEISLQLRVTRLCYQLLPEFSIKQFETLHRCYKHTENVRVSFCRCKNNI